LKNNPAVSAFIIIAIAIFLTVSCGEGPPNETTYAINVEGAGNEVFVETEEDSVIFEVFSERGIGAASIVVIVGDFPPFVALKLQLNALEELRFAYGETEVLISVSSSRGNVVRESVILGSEGAEQETPIAAESSYWMDVVILQEDGSPGTIPLAGGVILVALPEDFISGAYDSFQIRWIDYYR
jgi:hypothetical protein